MANQFPTLEATAGLVLTILAWRALLLVRDLRAIAEINEELLRLLRRGELGRALGCCEALARASYARVARRIVVAARDFDPRRVGDSASAALTRVGAAEAASLDRRLRAARARDLAGLAVLLGAAFYGFGAQLGSWFVGMSAGGAGLMLFGGLLRGRIALRSREAAAALAAEAARAATARTSPASGAPAPAEAPRSSCPRCSEDSLVRLAGPGAWQLHPPVEGDRPEPPRGIELTDIEACPLCGCVVAHADRATVLLPELHARAPSSGFSREDRTERETEETE